MILKSFNFKIINPYLLPGIPDKKPGPEQIIKVAGIACNISTELLLSSDQTRKTALARCLCTGLIFENYPEFTLIKLAAIFKRHHSTVIYYKRLFNDLMETDKDFQSKVAIAKKFFT